MDAPKRICIHSRWDNVTISEDPVNGVVSDGPFCGNEIPPTYTSSGDYAAVIFSSDGLVSGSGFEISYTCKKMTEFCGEQLAGPSGTFHSPGWPNNYPDNAECFWGIDCGQTEIVQITFNSFDVEEESSCK